MSAKYLDLKDYNISFKHLISGPAPVGMILNYVKLAGEGKLYHRTGNRSKSLAGGVAYSWCSEFTVGLGLLYYKEERGKAVPLYLTENGKKLYELIKDYAGEFDTADVSRCRSQLLVHNMYAYKLFFGIFKSSPVCKTLCLYIENAGTNKFLKSDFKDDYFGYFKVYYEGGDYAPTSHSTTGDNRVPSLLQLCEFFGCLTEDDLYFIFNLSKLPAADSEGVIPIDEDRIKEIKEEYVFNERVVRDLVKKYGVDGTVAREIVTRNSTVQDIFRHNLIAKYGCKCAVCEKNIESVLVASHIVPAAEVGVIEKADCENGLLLCALHDKLFDRYLITFDGNTGKLIYGEKLKGRLEEYQLSEDTALEQRFMTGERKKNLLKHNAEFCKKNTRKGGE